jgi:hypothetical protein
MNGVKQFCIQLADSVFRKKYRDIENRKFIRLRDSISLNMRLVDAQTEKIYSRQIEGSTVNISREGLCIESSTVTVDGVDIFNDAMSDERCLEIEIKVPDEDKIIKTLGKVVWLDMTPKHKSFLFKAGVFLDLSQCIEREDWYNLVDSAKRYGTQQSWLSRLVSPFFKAKK